MTPDEDRNVRARLDMVRRVIANNLRVLAKLKDDECDLRDLSGAVIGRDDMGIPVVAATLAELIEPDPECTCHIVLRQSDSDFTDEPHYLCSRCGKEGIDVFERDDYTLAGIVSHAPYCKFCGARVVEGGAR